MMEKDVTMNQTEKTTAIVLSAGRGSRMQTECPKQYLMVNGHPVISYTLRTFEQSPVDEIILVCAEPDISYCTNLVETYGLKKVTQIVAGGKERYDSVYAGLQAAAGSSYVLIHDGARPYVTTQIISRMMEEAKTHLACVAAVKVKDTIKVADAQGKVLDTPPRDSLWQIQTPQAFVYDQIVSAYEKAIAAKDRTLTDDAMVMERYGNVPVWLVESSYRNTKLTTPEDLELAKVWLKKS
jgi:2-C-methyl-D-erythritol 4-phosphate cytidylyltransferase